ncbi:MAG: hypothetical protein ACQEXC_09730 [Pseudomonadota bacterium]
MEAEDKIIVFECRGDARSFSGQLCVYDAYERVVWDFYDPKKKYNCIGMPMELDGPREPVNKDKVSTKKENPAGIRVLLKCKLCEARLKPTDTKISKHYKKAHNCLVTISEGNITGVLILSQRN